MSARLKPDKPRSYLRYNSLKGRIDLTEPAEPQPVKAVRTRLETDDEVRARIKKEADAVSTASGRHLDQVLRDLRLDPRKYVEEDA